MSKGYSGGNRKRKQNQPAQTEMAQSVEAAPSTEPVVCLATLSPHDRKAEAWARHEADERMFQTRCHECNGPMWTWNEKEDICETCGFELRQRREELRRMRDQKHEKGPRNAFERGHDQHVPVGIEGGKQRPVNPFQTTPSKPHAVGITTTRKFHNPFGS